MTVVFRPSGVWMISFIAIEFDLTPQDYSPMPTHPSDTLQLRCVQGGSTTSLIEPSADKMSCDFTSNQLVQESTFPSTSPPPTSNSRLPTSQPTLPPTSVKIHLTLKPPPLSFTLTPTLPCCLHASWLCSCLSPWDLPPSHWSKPPPFSVLIGRGGRGRGHGGGEALPGPPLHAGQT